MTPTAPRRPSRLWKAARQLTWTLLALVLLEGLLALLGVRPALVDEDPFVGFSGHVPLFVPSADGSRWETAENKLRWFNPQSFAATKPEGTTRVFCLGGSTVYGRPYDDRTSFCAWLRELLAEAGPGRFEVVNAGGISYASYRVAVVLEEVLRHEPDVIVIYTGHNEFLERRSYPELSEGSLLLPVFVALGRTRLFTVARDLLTGGVRDSGVRDSGSKGSGTGSGSMASGATEPGGTPGSGPDNGDSAMLQAEVATLLDDTVGPDAYTRDDALRDAVVEHFAFNLDRMARMAEEADVRLVLITPAGQLRDCRPFKSEHTERTEDIGTRDVEQDAALDADADASFEATLAAARAALAAGRATEAVALLEPIAAADPRHALARYLLGEARFAGGDALGARAELIAARDEDICALRALSGMPDRVREAAAEHDLLLVDFLELVEADCRATLGHDLPGREHFLDHVHPTRAMHRLLGEALFEALVDAGTVALPAGWDGGAIERAAARIDARVDRAAHARALRNRAKVLGWAGKDDEAARLAAEASALAGGGDAESHFLSGVFAAQAGRLDEAVVHYRAALVVDPGYAEAHYNLGEALVSLGNTEEALGAFREAARLQPDKLAAHNNLALMLIRAGRPAEALAPLEEALLRDPTYAPAHVNRGLALARLGRTAEAEQALRIALRHDADHAGAHSNLGQLLAARDEVVAALDALRRATELAPAEARYHRLRGELAARLALRDEAAESLGEALRLDPDDARARAALDALAAVDAVDAVDG